MYSETIALIAHCGMHSWERPGRGLASDKTALPVQARANGSAGERERAMPEVVRRLESLLQSAVQRTV